MGAINGASAVWYGGGEAARQGAAGMGFLGPILLFAMVPVGGVASGAVAAICLSIGMHGLRRVAVMLLVNGCIFGSVYTFLSGSFRSSTPAYVQLANNVV